MASRSSGADAAAADTAPVGRPIGVMFVGPGAAGKTSLFHHYCRSEFDLTYNPTRMMDTLRRPRELINGIRRDVVLKDTPGQWTMANALTTASMREVQVVFIVVDVTSYLEEREALDPCGLQKYIKKVRSMDPNCAVAMMFNKCDLLRGMNVDGKPTPTFSSVMEGHMATDWVKERVVSQGLQSPDFFFTSARSGDGTKEAIEWAFRRAEERVNDSVAPPPTTNAKVTLPGQFEPTKKQNTNCCNR